jgi:hypothetical protein
MGSRSCSRIAGAVSGLAAAMALAACGQAQANDVGDDAAAAPGSGEFVAYTADFDGYRGWSHITVFDDGGAGSPVHAPTTLVEYINRSSPGPHADFPVGTILVKESASGDPDTRQAFAMTRRGGTFNPSGAAGWEWFELQNTGDAGTLTILWRGVAPPAGEVYAGNVNGDCNTCHEKAPHDGVFAQ